MPSGHNPAPYPDDNFPAPYNYFGTRDISSTVAHDPSNNLTESKTITPNRNNSIARKPLPFRRQQNASSETILRHSNVLEQAPNEVTTTLAPPSLDIRSRPPSVQVNHTADTGQSPRALPVSTPLPQQPQPFLGRIARLTEPGGSHTRKVIVISYHLVSMSQVPTLRRFFQSLKAFIHGDQIQIQILKKCLPVYLGDRSTIISWSSLLLKAVGAT